ncbi:hypothetical protein MesoLj113c_29980 [Mesorhizobium sp. 113-3-9]|uniref:TRAFAC clade GTPase domain-containing protein n=1 Tax=Mesorhizobium sp. 113-3-9 TaxID=2744517 RepID=UPI001925EB53|nr:hypothetical protein [Mesorhizobium sp. 113-3-9]BCG86888.1 hypothetical protein MesoLj113c_29980 [Mesorhizobium sp. 113-3-9]
MIERVCDIAECTFPQTGVCVRSYPDPADCPDHQGAVKRIREMEEQNVDADSDAVPVQAAREISGEAVLSPPEDKPQLPRSSTLGLREADRLMRSRYVNMIGVVGLPDAGKTACIASLYLLLAHGSLKGFSYANSQTLMALEEIARGTRRWNDGDPPKQMTVHTELADDRQAGFLHLRLRRAADSQKFDILVPDLPGEWSRTLINRGDVERFSFLRSAEVIWLMVDGREFVEAQTRELAIHKTTNLIERLANILDVPRPRTILVASWRDKGDFPEGALKRVQASGEQFGFAIELASIASFSDNNDVHPGIGMSELIEGSLTSHVQRPDPWPAHARLQSERAFLNFGTRV